MQWLPVTFAFFAGSSRPCNLTSCFLDRRSIFSTKFQRSQLDSVYTPPPPHPCETFTVDHDRVPPRRFNALPYPPPRFPATFLIDASASSIESFRVDVCSRAFTVYSRWFVPHSLARFNSLSIRIFTEAAFAPPSAVETHAPPTPPAGRDACSPSIFSPNRGHPPLRVPQDVSF